jgi:hypothetical protein
MQGHYRFMLGIAIMSFAAMTGVAANFASTPTLWQVLMMLITGVETWVGQSLMSGASGIQVLRIMKLAALSVVVLMIVLLMAVASSGPGKEPRDRGPSNNDWWPWNRTVSVAFTVHTGSDGPLGVVRRL